MSLYHCPQYRVDLETAYDAVESVEDLKDSRIVVTGATGLIGRFLIDVLLYANETKGWNCEIFAACRNEEKFRTCFINHVDDSHLHFFAYEIQAPLSDELFVDYIVHCAGDAYPAAFMKEPAKTLLDTILGTKQILAYARKHTVKRILFLSSGEVYGQASEGIQAFAEEDSGYLDSMKARSCYPLGKRAAENLCVTYGVQYGIPTVVARLCHTYGPTASSQDNRVAQTFVKTVLEGRDIVMKSKGEQRRSWCYVADAVSGILTLLLRGKAGEAYNIATPISRETIRGMAELVAVQGGRKVEFRIPEQAESMIFNPMELAVLSSEKIEKLGWRATYTLEKGMLHMMKCSRWNIKQQQEIALFGAGSYAMLYHILIAFLEMDVYAYIDNDIEKQGRILHGHTIMPPKALYDFDGDIVISCPFEEQIKQQLTEMNIKNRIVNPCSWVNVQKALRLAEQHYGFSKQNLMGNNQTAIVIDAMGGTGWGGTEVWSFQMAEALAKEQTKPFIYGTMEQAKADDEQEHYIKRFYVNESKPEDIIESMVQDLVQNLPCVVINNFCSYVIFAAIIVKHLYPDQVKIISVIHNDMQYLFDKHMLWREEIDSFFCVSEKIRRSLRHHYHVPKNMLYFKESPIKCEDDFEKKYSTESMPLRIGYGARLDQGQKRADLFPILIQRLEESGIHYSLEIAGTGDCYKKIQTYILANHLQSKVVLLGRLESSDMPAFWKRQDIYLNFSEYEGTSLAMLQAMSYGCVPVVTEVSGVGEFITDAYNGFICEVGDLRQIERSMVILAKERTRLLQYGTLCRKVVRERCSWSSYIQYWKCLLRREKRDEAINAEIMHSEN